MGTTRQRRRRAPADNGIALHPGLVDLLLFGWGSRRETRDPDPFQVFCYTDADLRAAWHQHRSVLMTEWQRQGAPGQPWGKRFDEEA